MQVCRYLIPISGRPRTEPEPGEPNRLNRDGRPNRVNRNWLNQYGRPNRMNRNRTNRVPWALWDPWDPWDPWAPWAPWAHMGPGWARALPNGRQTSEKTCPGKKVPCSIVAICAFPSFLEHFSKINTPAQMTITSRTGPKFCARSRSKCPDIFFLDLKYVVIPANVEPWSECQPGESMNRNRCGTGTARTARTARTGTD